MDLRETRGSPVPAAPSHLKSLLQSNRAPTLQERSDIVYDRYAKNNRSSELDDEVTALKQSLARAEKEKLKVHKTLVHYKQVLHPLREIPTEVLSRIFFMAIGSLSTTSFSSSQSYSMWTVWKIAQVCQKWRDILFNLPAAWSTVYLKESDFPTSQNIAVQRAFKLGVHLQRARSHPLTVVIIYSLKIPSNHHILQALLPTSPRWKVLSLCLKIESYVAFSPIRGFLQSLEELRIQLSTNHQVGWYDRSVSLFDFVPKLRLMAAPPIGLLASQPADITYYEDSAKHTSAAQRSFQFLSSMTSLTHCKIHKWDHSDGPELKIHLPNLTELVFSSSSSVEQLSMFELPSLTHLSISWYACGFEAPIAKFKTLQHLCLGGPSTSMAQCYRLIGSLNLSTFFGHVDDTGSMAGFLDPLIQPTFAPSLLAIHLSYTAHADLQQVCDAVRAARPTLTIDLNARRKKYIATNGFYRDWDNDT